MSSGKGAKNKSSTDETAGKKKVSGQEPEDTSNAAILLALHQQEERLTGKVKLAVREAVEEILAGEIQALKTMIEASNSAVNKLSGDIAQQAEVGRKLQGRLDATSANVRAVKHDVGDIQKELLNLRQKVAEMEDRSRRSNLRLVGLPELAEGENAIQFLQDNLPLWIPSLWRGENRNSTGSPYIHHSGQDQPSTYTHLPATSLPGQGENSQRSQGPFVSTYTPDDQRGEDIGIQAAVLSRLQQRYRAEEESLRCREETTRQQRTTAVPEISCNPEG